MTLTATQDNVETVRGLYESFADGDIDAIAATFAPDIEFSSPAGLIGGGTFDGEAEIREKLFAELTKNWEDASVVPEQVIESGDIVVVRMTFSGTASESGASVVYPGVHVFEFEDGLITQWTTYGDTALFNAALAGD